MSDKVGCLMPLIISHHAKLCFCLLTLYEGIMKKNITCGPTRTGKLSFGPRVVTFRLSSLTKTDTEIYKLYLCLHVDRG